MSGNDLETKGATQEHSELDVMHALCALAMDTSVNPRDRIEAAKIYLSFKFNGDAGTGNGGKPTDPGKLDLEKAIRKLGG